MKPVELQRNHLIALIRGDVETAATLRALIGRDGNRSAAEFLSAATAVCIEYRFGPGAGLGAGPIDYEELAAFMAEVREAGRAAEPPLDYLAVEAVVRSLYGETHLAEPLGSRTRSQALYTALRHQVRCHPWLAANAEAVADRAKLTSLARMFGNTVDAWAVVKNG